MKYPLSTLLTAASLFFTVQVFSQAPKLFEWRGVAREGIYQEKGLLKQWPADGPALVWEYEGVGNGYGSPVFTDDNMYIMGEADSLAWLFAFDKSGNLKWKKDYGRDWVKNYNGSRCAPTIVGDLIYVTSGMGNIYCFNRHTGEKKWSKSMIDDLHGQYPLFGFSEANSIDGDRIFCTPGGRDTNVAALNRFTGDVIWTNKGHGERPGYNQTKIIYLKKRNVLVTFTAYEMLGLDTRTGELLWVHEQDNTPVADRKPGLGDTHANSVLYEGGYIYYAAGDGNGGVKLQLAPDGSSIKEVWRNADFDSYMGGIVKIGDYLYGDGTKKPGLKSVNALTGAVGKELKISSGALIADDGMLYFYNYRGEVMLINADPLTMDVISKFRITKGAKEHFAHPVIHDGKLYVRHGNFLMAFNIKS
jgi:outer membrane protein assembly factor BamB